MDFKDLFSDLDDNLSNVYTPEPPSGNKKEESAKNVIVEDEIIEDDDVIEDDDNLESATSDDEIIEDDDIIEETDDLSDSLNEAKDETSQSVDHKSIDEKDNTSRDIMANDTDGSGNKFSSKSSVKTDDREPQKNNVDAENKDIDDAVEGALKEVGVDNSEVKSSSIIEEDEDLASLFEEDTTSHSKPDYPIPFIKETNKNITNASESKSKKPETAKELVVSPTFYTFIRRKRIEYGYDLDDMSDFTGFDATFLAGVEKELTSPTFDEAQKILTTLGASDAEKAECFEEKEITNLPAEPEAEKSATPEDISTGSMENIDKPEDIENGTNVETDISGKEENNVPDLSEGNVDVSKGADETSEDNTASDMEQSYPEDLPDNKKLTNEEIGAKLTFLRERVGMSFDDVADDTDIDVEDIIGYENGDQKPSEEELRKLAECFGVEPKELIMDSAYAQRTDVAHTVFPDADPEDIAEDLKNEVALEESTHKTKKKKKKHSQPPAIAEVDIAPVEEQQELEDDVLPPLKEDDRPTSGLSKVLTVILIVAVITFALLGGALLTYGIVSKKEAPQQDNVTQEETQDVSKWYETENFTEALSEYDRAALYINDDDMELLRQYKEYNSDVYGIIKIADTVLNHPFAYTPEDEAFYLTHDLDKKTNSHGVPFMTANSRLGQKSTNSIIYGHNITIYEKDVFAEISQYENVDYYKEHPYIETVTDHGTRKWVIFAYYLVDTDDNEFDYWETTEFNSIAEFELYMNDVKKRNWLSSSIPLNIDDAYLTLSSCSNELSGSGTNRMVVMAKLLDLEEDCSEYVTNTIQATPLLPQKLR